MSLLVTFSCVCIMYCDLFILSPSLAPPATDPLLPNPLPFYFPVICLTNELGIRAATGA